HARAHPAEIDRELRRERTGSELRQRQALDVVLLGDPAALLDEIALHVAGQRDRPAEAERAEPQEVAEEPRERDGLGLLGFRNGCRGSGHRFAPALRLLVDFLDRYSWRSSRTALPRSIRASSLSWAMAMPAITCSMPAVSARPYFRSFMSRSCTTSPIAMS